MKSIRARLLLSLAAATTAIFAVAAVTTYLLIRQDLTREFDDLLAAKTRTLALLAEPFPTGVIFEFQEHGLADFTRAFEPDFYEAYRADGKLIADSGHTPKLTRTPTGTLEEPRITLVTLPNGHLGRMAAVVFDPYAEQKNHPGEIRERNDDHPDDDHGDSHHDEHGRDRHGPPAGPQPVTMFVARDTLQLTAALSRLAWMLAGVSAVAVAAILALLAWLVPRNLRPLGAFARQIAAIDETDLATRVPADPAPAEMAPVLARFNDLLQRLEGAFQREQAFSANVAHELRTPLAGLLATIEVVLRRERTGPEYREALARCEDISKDAHRLVEALLSLTRLESSAGVIAGRPLDLAALVESEWQKVAARADEKNIAASVADLAPAGIAADADQLRIVLANLFDNAVEYTPAGGSIDVQCHTDHAHVVLSIANGPCNLRPDQLPRMFDRFWRADAARSSTGLHAGLGLALAKRITEAAGGAIAATLNRDRFTITLKFKSAPVPSSSSAKPAALAV